MAGAERSLSKTSKHCLHTLVDKISLLEAWKSLAPPGLLEKLHLKSDDSPMRGSSATTDRPVSSVVNTLQPIKQADGVVPGIDAADPA